MFEKVVIGSAEEGGILTAGQIAEALLYYDKVHLVLNASTLPALIDQLGAGTLISILKRPQCSAVYCEDMAAVESDTDHKGRRVHRLIGVYFYPKKPYAIDSAIMPYFEERFSKSDARRLLREFLDIVPVKPITGNHFVSGGIVSAADADLDDKAWLHEVAAKYLRAQFGKAAPAHFRYEIRRCDNGFWIDHDLDFAKLNQSQQGRAPAHELSPLHSVLMVRGDLIFSAFYGGDFWTSELSSSIISSKVEQLLRTRLNREELKAFHCHTLAGMPRLCEVINSKQRTFLEFLRLLDKSNVFKRAVHAASDDAGLVSAYIKESTKDGWINKLPARVVRYLACGAFDYFSTEMPLTTAVIGFSDAFLVDKLAKRWKPSHFVEGPLSRFLAV